MGAEWCAEVFRETVRLHGAPEILNTDQGSQFTSEVFTRAVIKEAGSQLSMEGNGRAIDNVFIEYYEPPVDGLELCQALKGWFIDNNTDRRHTALNGEFPETVYELYKHKAPETA